MPNGRDHRGEGWNSLREQPRSTARTIEGRAVPTAPGVHVWSHNGDDVFVGVAVGKQGLRGGVQRHLSPAPDLSWSTFRASVAVEQLGVERALARSRPPILTNEQVRVVNKWIEECEVRWVECDTAADARVLKKRLKEAWLPRLNINE